MFRYARQEKGYSLLLALLVVVLISVFGFSLLFVTSNSVKLSTNERENQSVFYIAEGGLNKKISEIERISENVYIDASRKYLSLSEKQQTVNMFETLFQTELSGKIVKGSTTLSFENQFNESPKAIVTVDPDPSNVLKYKILSQGEIGNKKRTLSQAITIKIPPPPPVPPTSLPPLKNTITSAIHAIENINLTGGTFNGDIVSDKGTITVDWGTTITGKLGTTPDKFSKPQWMNYSPEFLGHVAFPERILPIFPDDQFSKQWPYTDAIDVVISNQKRNLVLKDNSIIIDGGYAIQKIHGYDGKLPVPEDLYLKNLSIESGVPVSLEIGNTDRNLYVENLLISENAKLNVSGSGKLNIYVKNSFKFEGSAEINNLGKADQMNIYYAGSSDLLISDNVKMNTANIYAKSANMTLNGSGSINGNLFNGGSQITITGGSYNHNLFIYAPNATVNLSGSGTVIGGIMARIINASGGPKVTYKENPNVPTEEKKQEEEDNDIDIEFVDTDEGIIEVEVDV